MLDEVLDAAFEERAQLVDDIRRSHVQVLRSTLNKHLLPALGDRPVGSITKADVLGLRKKLAELPGRGGKPGLPTGTITYALSKIIERCVGSDAKLWAEHLLDVISPGQQQAACAALSELRTWDMVTLRGERVLQGDLLWLRVGDKTFNVSILSRDSETELRWRRDLLGLCFILAIDGALGRTAGPLWDGRRTSLALDVDDCLYFHEVGQPQANVIALSTIDRIRMG